jgi:hypothetical protein
LLFVRYLSWAFIQRLLFLSNLLRS